jgi:predicted nuclease of restriction endonuclease-like (RecB) superfamily
MKIKQQPVQYGKLLQDIKARILAAQYQALRAVNRELIGLYWDIGRMIVERQKGKTWGKAVVARLAVDLQKEFPGGRGYSAQNLWYMRQFYLEYKNCSKLQSLIGEISWTKHLIIMSRCKEALRREFYIRMTRRMGWSTNVLIHQVEQQSYEKTLLSQTNFSETLPTGIRDQAKIAVKDEYTFDFLELAAEHTERQFEKAVLARMARFLREMGGALAFIGSQYRLELSGKEYFIDLLLYHRHLRCLVAIELKAGEFLPEYVGKMQFYLATLDSTVKEDGENPAIGIIVCKTKDKMTVEYALRESRKPIGVATYKVTTSLPRGLKRELPGPEQIARLIEKV